MCMGTKASNHSPRLAASAFITFSSQTGLSGEFKTPANDLPLNALQKSLLPMLRASCDPMNPSTLHMLINGDARDLSFLDGESVHLVIAFPPYWNLKRYNTNPNQWDTYRNMNRSLPNWKRCGSTYSVFWFREDAWSVLSGMSA